MQPRIDLLEDLIHDVPIWSSVDLLSLSRSDVSKLMGESKVLKFSAPTLTFADFAQFSAKHLAAYGVDPSSYGNRPTLIGDGTIYEAVKGQDLVLPHGELYSLPEPPDYVFFYCAHPAASGGETTLYDAAKVTEALSPSALRQLRAQRIVYTHRWTRAQWEPYFKTTSLPEVAARLAATPDVALQAQEDGTVVFTFTTSAFAAGGSDFVNGIANILSRKHQGINHVAWEDGRPIAAGILADINAATAATEVAVSWQAGDIVLINNHKVLHGRKAFTGDRKLAVRFGKRAL